MILNKSSAPATNHCNASHEFISPIVPPGTRKEGLQATRTPIVKTMPTQKIATCSNVSSSSFDPMPGILLSVYVIVFGLLLTAAITITGILLESSPGAFIKESKRLRRRQRRRWWWFHSPRTKQTKDDPHLAMVLERKEKFLSRVGDDYGYRGSDMGYIDDWRSKEFPSLQFPVGHENDIGDENAHDDDEREVYLDYAGSALPMKSQLEKMYQEASTTILANPHSTGPAASRTAEGIQRTERRVLKHLGALPGRFASLSLPDSFYKQEHLGNSLSHSECALRNMKRRDMDRHPGYDVLFTSGATEAFQIIADRFQWKSSKKCLHCTRQQYHSIYLYVTNSHNSVVGMRELAIQKGAIFHCLDVEVLEQMTTVHDYRTLEKKILNTFHESDETCLHCQCNAEATCRRHLLVFPSECNFSGDRPDAKSILDVARQSGWFTMLDIAKHSSTDRICLNDLNPDFCALSFYKWFGDPTGVGALLVRRPAISVLFKEADSADHTSEKSKPPLNLNNNKSLPLRQRHYQGGGSVDIMLPNRDYTVPRGWSTGLASLTSGTSHFRGIVNLNHGLDALDRLGGMTAVHLHASCLARELTRRLRGLTHRNGRAVVQLYGLWGRQASALKEKEILNCGPTLAMNVFRSDGTAVGYNEVSKLASLNRPPIQFRTGCFCNPGACQLALNLDDEQAIENYEKTGHVCGDHIDLDAKGMPTGAIRVSFGKDSLWEDLDVFVRFLESSFQNNYCSDIATTSAVDAREIATESDTNDLRSTSKISVSELYLFPIKSCSGQRASKWPLVLGSGKLQFDREFAIVDTSGVALRLQKCSKLGLISPVIDLEAETMTVSAPGCQDLVVLLSDDLYHGGENVVRVCGNKCGGRVWGDAFVSEWFSSFLGIQCWLARYSSPAMTTASFPSSRSGFSNEQPILLVSENAVATLNDVLRKDGQPICSAKRFRPNIVVRGTLESSCQNLESHMEDDWKNIILISADHKSEILNFSVEGACPRCTMVDYDPSTGLQKGKTLRALASYRRRSNGKIVFGIFLRAAAQVHQGNHNDQGKSQTEKIVWIHEGDTLDCKQ